MDFFWVVIGIFMVSFLLALWSLRELHAKKEVKTVEEELLKSRVIYQRESSSLSES